LGEELFEARCPGSLPHTKRLADRRDGWIELDFPAVREQRAEAPPGLAAALGTTPTYVGKNKFDYLVETESRRVSPQRPARSPALKKFPVRGIILTSRSSQPGFDFMSRFFAPGSGIDEDPATGSSHCCLGPYWSERLGKREFTAYQASPRGGVVRVRLEGDRVRLAGQAVTVLCGELSGGASIPAPETAAARL
jgi:predicted PhzF superfamily epimerase YddE/YHI9